MGMAYQSNSIPDFLINARDTVFECSAPIDV